MTTQVTIKVPISNHQQVGVIEQGYSPEKDEWLWAGGIILNPGDNHHTHVWEGHRLIITEVANPIANT